MLFFHLQNFNQYIEQPAKCQIDNPITIKDVFCRESPYKGKIDDLRGQKQQDDKIYPKGLTKATIQNFGG